MPDETLDIDDWLAARAREVVGEDPDKHPSVESISSYHARELSAEESQEIQQHLAACRECTRLLLALSDALTGDQSSSETGDDLRVKEDWGRFRARIQEEREPLGHAVLRPFQTLPQRQRAIAYALAALLSVAIIGFSIYALRQSMGAATKSTTIFVPSASIARSVDLVKEIELDPRENRSLVFVLEAPTGIGFPAYSLEIRDAQGKTLLRREALVKKSEGFNFEISSSTLKEGRFEIQVQGLRDGHSTIVGKYWIEIDHL